MALELVANEDMQVNFSNSAGPADIAYTGDVGIDAVKVVPTKSSNCKANAKSVCTTSITLTFSVGGNDCPHTSATETFIAGGGTVTVTATKAKADGSLVLRKGDTGTCAGTWQNPGPPPPAPTVCACSVEISDAGQTKVKAQ